jgi:hypothetical protein
MTEKAALQVATAPAAPSQYSRVCVSLASRHTDILSDRARIFNLGPTAVFKLLLDIERREGLIAKEFALRLNPEGRRRLPPETLPAA